MNKRLFHESKEYLNKSNILLLAFQKINNSRDYYNKKEVAAELGISLSTMDRRMASATDIPIYKETRTGTLLFPLSAVAENYVDRVNKLEKGDRLLLLKDVQNSVDPHALILRAENNDVKVIVQKVNHSAPLQLKLLCKLTAKFPKGFSPFDDELFKSFTND